MSQQIIDKDDKQSKSPCFTDLLTILRTRNNDCVHLGRVERGAVEMGSSGVLLKRKEEFDIEKSIRDVREAAEAANMIYLDGVGNKKNKDGTYKYFTVNLRDKALDSGFLAYIYGGAEDYEFELLSQVLDFLDKKHRYQHCVNIENFEGTKTTLGFLYEYLKRNKNDVFWFGESWQYTYDDIKKIASKKPYDPTWWHKDPRK